MTDVFSNNIQSGDLLTAEHFRNIHSFLQGSSVAGGTVSAQGINVPSEFARNPRTVRFIAEETIETYSIIELTEQVEDASGVDNQVPTFKAKPATGDAGTLFYTESSFADSGEAGMAYSIGGEPILIRSAATEDGSPSEGEIVANPGGAFRYLGESDVPELKWFLPVQGGGGTGEAPAPRKVRLVQPKELFPACEYKSEDKHYIVCPGGRDAAGQARSYIDVLDLETEQWTATTLPEMRHPMYNMDAKVVELKDETHQLVILSGQTEKGFSSIIQGYNFELNQIREVVDMGTGAINFAGRPALVGDPMRRDAGFSFQRPQGEDDFSRSLIVVGGSERSSFLRANNTNVMGSMLFSVQGSTLAVGTPYPIQLQNSAMPNVGHTGLPFGFFNWNSYQSEGGQFGNIFANTGKISRHQHLPVRGILRRRPVGNTSAPSSAVKVVDFLLVGGFNTRIEPDDDKHREHNECVVSGVFLSHTFSLTGGRSHSMYQMIAPHATFNETLAEDRFLTFPPAPRVLGDCCAEYVEERDEVICFGGRAVESETATAHANLAVLEFTDNNTATWVVEKYPPMPNPRWSAASVLIRGLVRAGETPALPADRIFIIGGRNRDGFVAAVDVFNLRTNTWETDWKGLDEGELENVPPSIGGGNTIIIQGGGGANVRYISMPEIDRILTENGM